MKKRIFKILSSICLVSTLSLSFISCDKQEIIDMVKNDIENKIEEGIGNSPADEGIKYGISRVHFIDTGNSDSILVENNGEYMLIDAGDNDDDETVVSYLKNKGITKLKYVVMTHPHADHIGGMDSVIKDFDIEKIISGQGVSTSKTYEKVLTEIKNKGYKMYAPKDGEVMNLGAGVLEFYNSQNKDYGDELNNSSVIVKYRNGEDDFLFMGDAEKEIEDKIKNVIGDIEVLKAGHHGSNSSSDSSFLQNITPEHIMVMCGANNKYGHPHQEVIDRYESIGARVYRSDIDGDIVFSSSGSGNPTIINKGINFN